MYFDNMEAEILESSSGMIRMRRPDIVNDSSTVTVVSYDALLAAKFSPYRVDDVVEHYGNFLDNDALSALAMDKDENLYVVFTTDPRNIYKVTPDGDKTIIGSIAGANVSGAKIAPNGNLILIVNDEEILQIDMAGGADTTTVWAEVDKRVKYGDFDEYGNFYTGSRRTDLIVVKTDLSSEGIGVYARDEIFDVRVFDGYVYVLVESDAFYIYRHQILDADGNVGDQEPVLDWAETGEFADSEPLTFTFDENGTLYVGTDNEYAILSVSDEGMDIFYKGIIPGPAKQLLWGNGHYLYMIWDDAQEETVLRIDMGVNGAPYYGR